MLRQAVGARHPASSGRTATWRPTVDGDDDARSSSTPGHVTAGSVASGQDASVDGSDSAATTSRPVASVPTGEAANVAELFETAFETGPAGARSLGDAGWRLVRGEVGVRRTASF
jgi:hypothetical protein